jgi:Rrf2 family transcriptional regulator, cysteine metabolism repressor
MGTANYPSSHIPNQRPLSMKLSRTIAYGIHATIQLARAADRAPIPSSQLAREGRLPERFLVQILRFLVTNGVLRSTCGVSGGYSLSRPPEEITLRDIVESLDNPLEVHLPELDRMPHGVRCRVIDTLDDASAAARAKLEHLTLADLLPAAGECAVTFEDVSAPSTGLQLHLMDSNEFETASSDSALTR